MTEDPLDRLWTSDANSVSPADLERLRPALVARLARERRRLALLLLGAGAMLAVLTILFASALVGGSGVEQPGGWATGLLLLPPWIAFALFTARLLRQRGGGSTGSLPIRSALAASLDDTRAALSRVRTIAALHLVSAPILAFAVRGLTESGRVAANELFSLVLVLAVLLLATGGLLLAHYFLRLKPRARRLEALLASYS
jgi:hypothetical protein